MSAEESNDDIESVTVTQISDDAVRVDMRTRKPGVFFDVTVGPPQIAGFPHVKAVAIPAPTPEQRGTEVWLHSLQDLHRLFPTMQRQSREYSIIEREMIEGYGVVVVVMTTPTVCDDCGRIGAVEEGKRFGTGSDIPAGWWHFGEPVFRLCCTACANERNKQ